MSKVSKWALNPGAVGAKGLPLGLASTRGGEEMDLLVWMWCCLGCNEKQGKDNKE